MVLITRREAINKRFISKNKILASLIAGVFLPIIGAILLITDPVHMIVKYKLRVAKDSIVYNLLQSEIPGARLSLYLFNITNGDRFISGEDYKLKVKEVGPFVFQEYRWYEDLQFSEDGKELALTPKFRTEFLPEESIAHPNDVELQLPNLPLLSSVTLLSNYPLFVHLAFNALANQLGSKAIMNIKVHDYIWGYKNPLITLCNKLAPGLVYFDKMGLFDRLYDNESDYRLLVGATEKDRFSIKSVKKFRHLNLGNVQDVEETEFTFNDTYEGGAFPPMLTPDIPINLYRLGICQSFNLKHVGYKNMEYGGDALVYTLSNETFAPAVNPLSQKAYPSGLMDISKCFYGLPFVVSKGHLLDADPHTLDRIDGLHPDRNVHVSKVVIDRKVSVTFETHLSVQLNMVIDDVSSNRETKMFSNSIVPIVHLKVGQPKMTEGTMSKFYLVYQIAPLIVLSIAIVTFILGFIFLTYAVRSIHVNWFSQTDGITFKPSAEKQIESPLIRPTNYISAQS